MKSILTLATRSLVLAVAAAWLCMDSYGQPIIDVGPANVTTNAGATVTFSVSATGSGQLNYRWMQGWPPGIPLYDGGNISGAASSALTISNVGSSDGGFYYVDVIDSFGTNSSSPASLTVILPLQCSISPSFQAKNTNDNAFFFANANGGTQPYSFQWSFKGSNIASGSSLALGGLSEADAGVYTLRVTDSSTAWVEATATLTVNQPPTITQQPTNRIVAQYSYVTFTAEVAGVEPLSYQWRTNGVDIPGATNPTYTIPSASYADEASYSLLITNLYGSVLSSAATLTIGQAPSISVVAGTNVTVGDTLVLTASATGTQPLEYQWKRGSSNLVDGAGISGATSNVLTISDINASDEGYYFLWVSNAVGWTQSMVHVMVHQPPTCSAVADSVGHWWPAESDFVDVAKGLPGTLYGAPGTVAAKVGNGWSFNGSSDRLEYATGAMQVKTGDFALECWIRTPASNSFQAICSFGTAHVLGITSSGGLQFWPCSTVVSSSLNDNQFHHVAVSRSGSMLSFYVDGTFSGSSEYPAYISETSFWVGSSGDGSYFTGVIDELTFYNGALSAPDLQAIYSAGALGKCALPTCSAVPSGLVGWWPGDWTATDVISGKDALLGGGYTQGKVGGAFAFDGIGSYVTVSASNAPALDGSFTIEMWMKPDSFSGMQTLFSKQSGGFSGVAMAIDSSGELIGYFNSSVGALQTIPWQIPMSKFTHVAYVFDDAADLLKIYTNGTIAVSVTETGTLVANSADLQLGASGTSQYFMGAIDEFSVYSRALTDLEIQAIHASGFRGKCPAPPEITQQPSDQTKQADYSTMAMFSVVATGREPLTYQWMKNGTNLVYDSYISGETTPNLMINPVRFGDAGTYSVRVSNAGGSVVSSNAILTVVSAPVISMSPSNQTALPGSFVTFTVGATGTEPITYQWFKWNTNGGTALVSGGRVSGATGNSLRITSLTTNDEGSYYVEMYNAYGSNTASCYLTILAPPTIFSPPLAVTNNYGTNISLSVVATGGSLVYQWRRNGTNIVDYGGHYSGINWSNLWIYNITKADEASGTLNGYSVIVSNAAGSVTSAPVRLIVRDPFVRTPPANQAKQLGEAASFFVEAGGTMPLRYQWKQGTTIFAGATSSYLTLANITNANFGTNYSVIVSNMYGKITNFFSLVPAQLPIITSSPTNIVRIPTATAEFTVRVSGNGPFNYTWRKNGLPTGRGFQTVGNNYCTYTMTYLDPSDSGVYDVQVYNALGTNISSPATLTVTNAPSTVSIVWPTNGATFMAPAVIQVSASVSDPDTLLGNVDFLVNGVVATNIYYGLSNGVVTATLPMLPADDFTLSARVTDELGASTSSAPVTISVTSDCMMPPGGVISWWRAENNLNDFFGQNNGIPTGGINYVPGRVGQGFAFDYNSAMVANSPTLSFPPDGAMTVEFWVYRTNSASDMMLIGKRDAVSANYELGCQSGYIFFRGNGTGATTYRGLPTNQWVHLAGTALSNELRLYIDGQLVATGYDSLGPTNGAVLTIGGSGTGPGFQGILDEVTIYNRALGDHEIKAIFGAGKEGKCSSTMKLISSVQNASQRGTAIASAGGLIYSASTIVTSNGLEGGISCYVPTSNSLQALWSTNWPGLTNDDRFSGLAVSAEGLYLAGDSYLRTANRIGAKENKGILVKFARNGAPGGGFGGAIWDKQVPPYSAYGYDGEERLKAAVAVQEGSNWFVYVTGSGQNSLYNSNRFFAAKMQANGTNVWKIADSNTSGTAFSEGRAIAVLGTNIFVAGRSDDYGMPMATLGRITPQGTMSAPPAASYVYGQFNGITAHAGAIFAVGQTTIGAGSQCLVSKWTASGDLLWSMSYPQGAEGILNGVVGLGNRIYAVGSIRSAISNAADTVILEIHPDSGALISTKVEAVSSREDFANGVTTDGTDLYVVGETHSLVAGTTGFILRYTVAQPVEPLQISTTALPYAEANVFYQTMLEVKGGTPPYAWGSGGGLPPGLTLSSDGFISGVPAGATTAVFTATVTDASVPPFVASRNFVLNVLATNNPPQIGTPTAIGPFTVGATIPVEVFASDSDPGITSVELFTNGVSAGTLTGSAGTYMGYLYNVAAGGYSIVAVATDGYGASSTSDPLNIRVNEPNTSFIDFEGIISAGDGSNYLQSFSIIASNEVPTATSLVRMTQKDLYGGTAVQASSGANVFAQTGARGLISFVLYFPASPYLPSSFSFTRVGLLAGLNGITHPKWRATAYDQTGNQLGEVSEDFITSYTNVPAKSFTLWGPDIAWVRFESDDLRYAAFNGVVLDDFVLGTGTIANSPPSVYVTVNAVNPTAPANVPVFATANDSDGISQIDFYLDDYFVQSVFGTNSAQIVLAGVGQGNHSVRAIAYDGTAARRFRSSEPVTFNVGMAAGVNAINFDPLTDTATRNIGGLILSNYLFGYGVTITNVTAGARVEAASAANLFGGSAVRPVSQPNVLSEFGVSGPATFTLRFNNPQQSVGFTRVKLLGSSVASGVTHPAWKARAFNASGVEVASAQEPLIQSYTNVPAQTFELAAPGIVAVKFDSDGSGRTMFPAVVIDDIVLNATTNVMAPLEVSITSPANNQSFTGSMPTTITVTADATNRMGGVGRVEFYAGPMPIGTAWSQPYSIQWTNVLPGHYLLVARVFDYYGGSLPSAPVEITVRASEVGGGNSTIINFDADYLWTNGPVTGAVLADYLRTNYGVTISGETYGAIPEAISQDNILSYGWPAVEAPSSPNVFTLAGYQSQMGFTLELTNPVVSFAFTRPKLKANSFGVSHPSWTATAYDSAWMPLASVSEASIFSYSDVEPQQFVLAGQGIKFVRFDSFNYNYMYSAFSSLLIDNIVMTGAGTGNLPPSVRIAYPEPWAFFIGPTNITIIADAIDETGIAGVTNVTFYDRMTNQIGSVTAPPFSVTWSNVDSGRYQISAVATDNQGASRRSEQIEIKVQPAPTVYGTTFGILEHPYDTEVAAGQDAYFNVSTIGGTSVRYQWYRGPRFAGTPIANATNALLVVPAVTSSSVGPYYAAVQDRTNGWIYSQEAFLTVVDAPIITMQPVGQTVSPGDTVTLSVSASGATPLYYQWYLNGNLVKGATDAMLTITAAQPFDSGNYHVVVRNRIGVAQSTDANVIVLIGNGSLQMADNFADRISINPLFSSVFGNNSAATLERGEPQHAGKTGGKSVWYTWHATFTGVMSLSTRGSSFDTLLAVYEGTPGNAQLTNLMLKAADDDSAGNLCSEVKFNCENGHDYEIAVDGYYGASGNVVLGLPAGGYRILDSENEGIPRIVTNPVGQSVVAGTNVTLTVAANNPSLTAMTYQWFYNDTAIPGATESSLTLTNFSESLVGRYVVQVANDYGSVESLPADLQLIAADLTNTTDVASQDKLADAAGTGITMGSFRKGGKVPVSSVGTSRGYTTTQIFSTVGATKDPGEPNHCGEAGGASQWYAYTAPASGTMHINTDGSSFNTVLAVYTSPGGFDYASLTQVACNNGSSGNGGDRVRFSATSGTVYYIAVDGVGGASGTVHLNINLGDPPSIQQAPQSVAATLGNNAIFTVAASGTTNLSYQWKFNGSSISGATGTAYTRTNVESGHLGAYTVVISNMINTVTSSPAATLAIATAPVIGTSPTSRTNTAGTSATLTVLTSSGSSPLSYQWYFNENAISAATATAFTLSSVQTTNVGSYKVVVTNVVGSVTSAVAIVGVKVPPPTPKLPKNNTIVSNLPVVVSGIAATNARITSILCSVNGGPFSAATGTGNWSNSVSLIAGTNVLAYKAVDASACESATTNLTLFYKTLNTFELRTNNEFGIVKATSSSFGTPTNGASLVVGKSYKLAATHNFTAGYVFTNWTWTSADGTGSDSNLALNFVMATNLTVTANYITNPFIAAAGTYNGLLIETNEGGPVVRRRSAGYISVVVTPKMSLSAKILLDGNNVSASGPCTVGGTFVKDIPRSTKFGKTTLRLSLALNFGSGSDMATGTLTDIEQGWVSEVVAYRSVWTTNRTASTFTNAYTMAIPGFSNPADGPPGYGNASIAVDNLGNAKVVGYLGDGQPLRQLTTITTNGIWPLFAQLYSYTNMFEANGSTMVKSEFQGIVIGWMQFATNTPAGKTTLAPLGNVTWIKTGWTNGLYNGGFTNGDLSVLGSLFVPPAVGTRVIPDALTPHVLFTNGNLAASFEQTFTLATNNSAKAVLPNANTVTLSIVPKTGVLKGTFKHPSLPVPPNKPVSYYGVILQDYTNGVGCFNGTNQGGIVELHAH